MVALEQVGVRLGRTWALRGVSFSIGRGETVGLVGPNGAGKTTALRVLAGYLGVDAGRATIDGRDLSRDRPAALTRVGYLPEGTPLYREMRVSEYLDFRARLKAIPAARRRVRVDEVVERFGLGDRRASVIERLSRGLRQRVGLADALLARPPVLLLDEPTTGLDPGQLVELRAIVLGLKADHTIVMSSHALGELAQVATRWIALVNGQVVGDGDPVDLRVRLGLAPDASTDEVYLGLLDEGHPSRTPAGGAA